MLLISGRLYHHPKPSFNHHPPLKNNVKRHLGEDTPNALNSFRLGRSWIRRPTLEYHQKFNQDVKSEMTISQYTPLDLQICFSDCCCVVPIKSIYEKMCSNLFHNKQQTHVFWVFSYFITTLTCRDYLHRIGQMMNHNPRSIHQIHNFRISKPLNDRYSMVSRY